MDELIALVVEKTGIPESTAKVAVETVLGYIKERLPDPVASRLDDVVEGVGKIDLDQLGGFVQGLGDLFGKK